MLNAWLLGHTRILILIRTDCNIKPTLFQLLYIFAAAVATSGRQTPGINLVRTNSYSQSQVILNHKPTLASTRFGNVYESFLTL